MKHGHISRNYAKAFFAFVTIAITGACADSTVAPSTEVAAFKAPAAFTKAGGKVTFRVKNSEGITKSIGSHVINIPAGAICDLSSSYGATEWDKPCTPMTGSVLITATVMYDDENHPFVDFQPAMRFAPNKEVRLFLKNGRSSQPTELSIDYCNANAVCVDESIGDPSLKTVRVGQTAVLMRRLKHFSGYMIAVGKICSGYMVQDSEGTWICYSEGNTRKSGYMVASGKDDRSAGTEKNLKKDEQ
jgi:hypothetical protein